MSNEIEKTLIDNKKDIIKPTFKINDTIKRVQTGGYEYDQDMLSKIKPTESISSTTVPQLKNTGVPSSTTTTSTGGDGLKLNMSAKSFVPKGLNFPNTTTNSSNLSTSINNTTTTTFPLKTPYVMFYDSNKQSEFQGGIPYSQMNFNQQYNTYGGNQNKFVSSGNH